MLGKSALAAEISVDCAELERERLEELDARMRLLLRAAPDGRRPTALSVTCTSDSARLDWQPGEPETVQADATGDLIEPILAAIDARLFPMESKPRTPPSPSTAPEQPSTSRRLVLPASQAPIPLPSPRPRVPSASGVALGVTAERWSALSGWAVGPHLEVSLGPNPVLLAYAESVRFGVDTDREAVVFDLAIGTGVGAPFAAGHPFGAFMLIGTELFSKFRRESTGGIPFAALGVRAAVPASRTLRLWVGVEGRLRASSGELDRLQALGTIGVFLPVESAGPAQ